jgi:hypothetical protein
MSKYQGTAQRIADWIGKEKRTVYKILKSLCEKGLIERHEKRVNDVTLNDYSVVIERVPGSAKNVPPMQEIQGGSAKNVPPLVQKIHHPSAKNAPLKDYIKTDHTRQDKDNPDLPAYFIQLWQSEPNIVNCMARLKSPSDWAEYWRLYQGTRDDIKRSWDNFITGVKSGAVERRFVPANPDTFILGDGLNRYKDPPHKKDGPKIGKDAVDDVSQFFKGCTDA